MSNEVEAVGEEGNDNQGLTPKRRFPEFRADGAWMATPLRQLCTPISEKVGNAKLTPVSITAGKGFVSQASKFGRDISGEQYRNYTYLQKGDFAYNKGNSTAFPQGYVCQLTEFDEAAASSAFLCFQLSKEHKPRFVQALFDQNVHGRQLASFITSGARSNGLLNIRSDDFYGVELPLPPKIAEQQKIAECLSSLDALISAETDKLAALKNHKNGLMQQLFPAEGETIPRLRFPEYQNDGEWEALTIGDVASVTTGKRDTQNKVDNGEYPFFVRSQTVERIDSFTFDGEAILTSGDGVGVGKNFHYITGKFDFHQRVYCIYNFNKSSYGKFIFQYFSANFSDHIQKLSAKNSVDSVRMSMITDMPLQLPSLPEQRKIAECLLMIDTLIIGQSDRIASLQTHKSGLMQQLFPSSIEATA